MNHETANRLLKLVEEPPEKTIFIFITHAPEKVLQTIFSRCQSIRVLPLSKEEAEKVKEMKPSYDNEDDAISENDGDFILCSKVGVCINDAKF
jgi:DNA polymerase III gamma/tau subunit